MRNRLTFTNVIGVLLENKKKTYPQHHLVRNLFSAYLDDTLTSSDLIVDDNIQYSRWCNGTRPIPMDFIKAYEDDEWDTMEDDFHDKIIPNLINPSNAHLQMQELLKDSIPVIGQHTAEMDEEALFHSHYDILKRLHSDSLIILDNFNVLPKDDGLMREFPKNDYQVLATTRCRITAFETLEIKELDKGKELTELFYRHCPSAKSEPDTIAEIIDVLNAHTLTVCLAALAINASGMEPDELLQELKSCGLNADIREELELYKDESFDQALLIEHLRKLLQINHLSKTEQNILSNLSLLPTSGIRKKSVKNWLQLQNLNDVNHMIQYGFVSEDTENKAISLHPLIQQIALLETLPSVTSCNVLLHTMHGICLVHGLDIRRPEEVLSSLVSINERIIVDAPPEYLLLLQDEFPYFEKYGVTDYLSRLVERIEYILQENQISYSCSKALLLDYKAELFYLKKRLC